MNEVWKAIWLEAHFQRFNVGKSSRQGLASMIASHIPAIDDVRHMSSAWLTDRKGVCGQSTDAEGHYQTIILDQVTCEACLETMRKSAEQQARRRDARDVSALCVAIFALLPKPPRRWELPPEIVSPRRRRRVRAL